MNQAKPHLHWCFLHLPRQPLTVIPLKTLQDLCFAYTFVTGLFNFVRIAILLDAFLHKRIKQTSKGSDFGSGVSVNKGCRVQNHTTACRKMMYSLSLPVHSPFECDVKRTRPSKRINLLCVLLHSRGSYYRIFKTWLHVQNTMKLAIKTTLNIKTLT